MADVADLTRAADAFAGVRPVSAELEARVRSQLEAEARLASGTDAEVAQRLDRLARALDIGLAALQEAGSC